jgi:hypothetical protein
LLAINNGGEAVFVLPLYGFMILFGLAMTFNIGNWSGRFHGILRLAWDRMQDSAFDRVVRLMIVIGAVPFWFFRLICFLTLVVGGVWGLAVFPY